MQSFSANGQLDFVPIDIVGPFSKCNQCSYYVFLNLFCFYKLTRAITTSKSQTLMLQASLLDRYLISRGTLKYFCTNYETQLVGKPFLKACALHAVKHLMTNADNPQSNAQAGRFNETIVIQV